MQSARVVHGNVLDFFEKESRPMYHSFFMDPPYGYNGGFMGTEWDKNSPALTSEFWARLLPTLLDGAIGFSYMSPENMPKMLEYAKEGGMVVLPQLFLWAQGRTKPNYVKVSDTHVYGKHAVKQAVEPVACIQKPYGPDGTLSTIRRTNAGTFNSSAGGPSSDGVSRFPTTIILDDGTASILDEKSGRTVSPFFSVVKRIESETPVVYVNKASRKERDAGLDNFDDVKVGVLSGRRDGSLGSIPIGKNDHPTVKPIELSRHFASLVLPPDVGGARRIIVPFSGVGSEIIGCLFAGWDEVVGIEMDERYCLMAEQRIKHYVPNSNVTVEAIDGVGSSSF